MLTKSPPQLPLTSMKPVKSPFSDGPAKPLTTSNNTNEPVDSTFSSSKSELEYEKIIAEFQPKKLCDSISLFSNLQKETDLAKANVEATRLLDINLEHIKQYRGEIK